MVSTVQVGVAVAAVLTLGLLARQDTRIEPEMGLAAAPWMVAGALAHVLAGTPGYPAVLQPPFGRLAVYATTTTAAGLLWFPFRQLAVRRGELPNGSQLAAGGLGAALALGAMTVATAGSVTVQGALYLVGVPIAAAVLAVGLGLAHHEIDPVGVGRTRALGLLVVFGYALAGLSWAVLLAQGQPVGGPAGDLIAMAGEGVPTGPPVVAAVPVALALLAVSVLGRLVERSPPAGNLVAVLVAAVGVGPGVEALLRATVLM